MKTFLLFIDRRPVPRTYYNTVYSCMFSCFERMKASLLAGDEAVGKEAARYIRFASAAYGMLMLKVTFIQFFSSCCLFVSSVYVALLLNAPPLVHSPVMSCHVSKVSYVLQLGSSPVPADFFPLCICSHPAIDMVRKKVGEMRDA